MSFRRATSLDMFLPQWKPEYLSHVFPFEIPDVTGGPEYTADERLRHSDAPFVDVFQYTRGLPRRVERQIRASWMLVPGLRNLYRSSEGC